MSEPRPQVRPATASEIPRLVAIAQAAQDKLTRGGSLQQIAGYSAHNLGERTQRGDLFVLEVSGSVIGGAFVEPVTPIRFPQIADWNVVPGGWAAWFLYGLVIAPEHQGRKWGGILLDGICRQKKFTPPAVLLLDCWAGNSKLRRFYMEAGFTLHGVFPEQDYKVAVFCRIL